MTGRERKPQAPRVEYEVRQKTGWQDSGESGTLYGERANPYLREPKKGGGDAAPTRENTAPGEK